MLGTLNVRKAQEERKLAADFVPVCEQVACELEATAEASLAAPALPAVPLDSLPVTSSPSMAGTFEAGGTNCCCCCFGTCFSSFSARPSGSILSFRGVGRWGCRGCAG